MSLPELNLSLSKKYMASLKKCIHSQRSICLKGVSCKVGKGCPGNEVELEVSQKTCDSVSTRGSLSGKALKRKLTLNVGVDRPGRQ